MLFSQVLAYFSGNGSTEDKKFLGERFLHDLEPLCGAFQCYVNCAQISSVNYFERSTPLREVRSSAVLRYRTIYGHDLRATSVLLTAVPYDGYRIAHVQLSTHAHLLHEADDDRQIEFLIFGEIGSSHPAETVRKDSFPAVSWVTCRFREAPCSR